MKPYSFIDLEQLDTDHLMALLGRRLTKENRRRIAYEIEVRSVELPEDWKLNNNK